MIQYIPKELYMCGLIELTEGRILIGGKDTRLYEPKDYHALFV